MAEYVLVGVVIRVRVVAVVTAAVMIALQESETILSARRLSPDNFTTSSAES